MANEDNINVRGNNPGGSSRRGFASMDPDKQRDIASRGGKAAHAGGKAHQWDSREASEAGRIGGKNSRGRNDSEENSSRDRSDDDNI